MDTFKVQVYMKCTVQVIAILILIFHIRFLFVGWLNTFEYYFETYTHKTLDLMVDQLTKNPTWRFVWSEVCWLDKWWNKTTPAQKDNFKRLKLQT